MIPGVGQQPQRDRGRPPLPASSMTTVAAGHSRPALTALGIITPEQAERHFGIDSQAFLCPYTLYMPMRVYTARSHYVDGCRLWVPWQEDPLEGQRGWTQAI